MTLTDEQVRAWLRRHQPGNVTSVNVDVLGGVSEGVWVSGCDCPHCVDERMGYALATEVLAQRARRCGTCGHWGDYGWCDQLTLREPTPADWFCADWRAKEPAP